MNGTQNRPFDYDARVCVPGSFVESLWSPSRDAESIFEQIYIGVEISGEGEYNASRTPYVHAYTSSALHCTANTTRGYFELPNVFNDFLPQPLLERFPRGEEVKQYNDYEYNDNGNYESFNRPFMGPT